jgi:tryptophan synthase alpha subunit
VEAVTSLADAAIVGSALVRRLADAAEPVAEAAAMLDELTPQKG